MCLFIINKKKKKKNQKKRNIKSRKIDKRKGKILVSKCTIILLKLGLDGNGKSVSNKLFIKEAL